MKTKNKKQVIVIGAGFGGLSAAAFLAKDGYNVVVIEKNDQPGGRAMIFEEKGFKFDMGPSWYMMPEVFDKWFEKLGKKRDDYFKIKRLDPNYKVFFEASPNSDVNSGSENAEEITVGASIDSIYELFEKHEPGSSVKLKEFLEISKFKYDSSLDRFLYHNFTKIGQLLDWELIKKTVKWNMLGSWQKHVDKYFKNPKLKQILLWSTVFIGGSPKNLPSLYSLMTHVDFNLGIWYPEEGFHSLVKGMHKVCEELGVTFKFDEEVAKIISAGKEIKSVITNKDEYWPDSVIANADYRFVEEKLLNKKDQSYTKKYWDNRVYGPHTYCVYLGINKKLKNLEHHNYYFGTTDRWNDHYDKIFENPDWPEYPSFYVSAPGKTDPNVAPDGKENIFMLVPMATGLNLSDDPEKVDSDENREKMFDKIMTKLEELLGENVRDHIEFKRIISHRDHTKIYNAWGGNSLGLAQTILQTALFRPRMQSKKIDNLFYTGHYTQPGTSTPICVISGEVAAKQVAQILTN